MRQINAFLGIFVVLVFNYTFTSGQTFNGTGGAIITLTDTSRFNIAVSGLSAPVNYTYGLESVTINITHSRDADIDCFLAAPDGTRIELTTDNGGTGHNFTNTIFRNDASQSITAGTAPFTGTYLPEGTLYGVNNGQNGNGTWQLRVIDDSNNGITGTVVSWSITFGSNPARPFIFDQSNLPILVINTNGQTIADSPKIICDMGIIDNGAGVRNHLTDTFTAYNGKIAIEIRGSSSQSFPKKSYGFETRDSTGLNKNDVSLFGMPPEHDWILSANYTDKTFCRNVLAYQLANEMGHYAVKTKYVDVVINGVYKGIYVFMEKIKRDGGRLDLKHLYTFETTYPDVSGGYIIKIDKTTGGGGSGWTSPYAPPNHPNGQTIYFQYEYPDPDSIVIQQQAYIQAYVDSFERSLNSTNFMDSALGYAQYIGNTSFIDYFFSNEISKNVDGYRISTFLYKDMQKTLKAGPVWDYDIAWGNANYCGGNDTTGWAYQFSCTNDGYQPPFWWQRMMQDSNYTNQLQCRWRNLRSTVLDKQHIYDAIDSIAAVLAESKDWNFTVWPILGVYVWPNPSPYPTTYAGEIQNLKNWVNTRLTWMDNNLPGRCNCSVSAGQQNVSCTNACDGIAFASGNSPYEKTYSWDTGIVNDSIVNLCPGPYILSFEDAIGCQRTVTVTITEPSPLTVNASATTASCSGNGCNATATAFAGGGTGPYAYLWSDGQSTATATGLCAGTFTVVVTDAHGCKDSTEVIITNPVAPVVGISSQTNVSCLNGSNGTASVSVSGGAPPFSYSWSPSGGSASTASGLVAGTYTATVTDAVGCEGRVDVEITEPTAVTASLVSTNLTCYQGFNGSVSATAGGGTSPYTYSWSPSGGTGSSATGLAAGIYTVTVTDFNGCSVTSTAAITEPSQILLSASSTSLKCSGDASGSAMCTANGGTGTYSYSWAPSGGTASEAFNLSAGTYTVTVTDMNACTATASTTVSQPALLSLSTAVTPSSCGGNNGTASVSVSGGTAGYAYLWSPTGGTSALETSLGAGTYNVTVTDANGCSQTATAIVPNSSGLSATISAQSNVSCFGGSNGSATVDVSGGTLPYSYAWSPSGGSGATATGLSPGVYSVTVLDGSGCSTLQQVTIGEPTAISLNLSSGPVSCFGGSNGTAAVSASGGTSGYTYSWSPSGGTGQTAVNLAAGTYTVTVTDAAGCTATHTVTVNQPAAISVSMQKTNATCDLNNGTATAVATGGAGGYHYLWTPGGDTTASILNLAPGNYQVRVTDANGCIKNASVSITGSTTPVLAVVQHNDVTCNGDNNGLLALAVSGGTQPITYQWTPNVSSSGVAANLPAGIYHVLVTDVFGCADSTDLLVDEPAPLAILMVQNNSSCFGANNGSIFADAGGGTPPYTYNWSPGGQTSDTARNLGPGTYQVTVLDALGCTSIASASITEPTAIVANLSTTNATCFNACNGTATVSVSGGEQPYYLAWCNGDTATSITGLCARSCEVMVTDGHGCTSLQQFTIAEPSAIAANVVTTEVTCHNACDGTAAISVSGGNPPYALSWCTGDTTSSVTSLCAQSCDVTVTDGNGCTSFHPFNVSEPDAIVLALSQTAATCLGCSDGTANVTASGGTAPYSYLWTPSAQTTAQAENLSAGVYTVCVTDSNFCIQCDSIEVLDGTIGIDELQHNTALYLFPNPFSEYTTFVFGLKQTQTVELDVLDMSGQLVKPVVHSELRAGEHLVRFDAGDLSSGVYIYRFRTDDRLQTGRLTIHW